jgi:hypothetical protein
VTLLSALAHDCEYLWLGITGFGLASAAAAGLMDILFDPSGGTSWTSLIDDLIISGSSVLSWTSSANGHPGVSVAYHFPLWLPAGASIGARARQPAAGGVTTGKVFAVAAGGNKNPASWWCGQKVETVGTFDAANSLGQAVTPGVSQAFGSWADLGSPTTGRAGAVQWGVGGGGSSDLGANTYRYEFGAGDTMIGLPVVKVLTPGEVGGSLPQMPIFCDIPEGTQLRVRGKTSATSIGAGNAAALDCVNQVV